MVFFTVIGAAVIIYYLVYLLLLCLIDCDLGLAISEKLGKKLGTIIKKFPLQEKIPNAESFIIFLFKEIFKGK